jgi:hypothetical protein
MPLDIHPPTLLAVLEFGLLDLVVNMEIRTQQ